MKKNFLLVILSVSLTGCFFLSGFDTLGCTYHEKDGLFYESDGTPCRAANRRIKREKRKLEREIEREEKMKEKENINK